LSDEGQKQIWPGLPFNSLHRLLQHFSMSGKGMIVRQNKGMITILQMPATPLNFLQLEHDYITFQQAWCPTLLRDGKSPSAICLHKSIGCKFCV